MINQGPELTGSISVGEATAPKNTGNIMSSMMSEMATIPGLDNSGSVKVVPGAVPQPTPVQAIPTQPSPPNPNPQPVTLTEPKKDTVSIAPNSPATAKIDPDVNFFGEESPKEEAPVSAQADEEPDMSDIPDEPAKENWKKAREALKTERKTVKQLNREYEQAKKKLESYEKGEIVPEVLTAKEARIQELEKYETVVQGRLSEEYDTLVTKPASEKNQALSKLAEDYQVPENIRGQLLQKIVETENERERNQLITKYFPDTIGATKVEALVKDLHQLGSIALEMEKKPAETFQNLKLQFQAKQAKEAESRASNFESVGKTAWMKALEKTASEGLYQDLVLDPNNAEHNKRAEKNQHLASIQYSALVKKLHANGLKTLPEDLAVGMARAIQLSIGGANVYKQLEAANQRIAELEGSNGMIATYLRPGTNMNGGGRAPIVNTNDKGPLSPQDAARMAAGMFKK